MFKSKIYKIIFEAETKAGKLFDVALLVLIILSILIIFLDSVPHLNKKYGDLFLILEWVFTIIFTIEYVMRIWIVEKPFKYVTSFFGLIDFLAVLPTYLSLFFVSTHGMVVLRAIRLLRMFRIFKLTRYINASNAIILALKRSRAKISVFLTAVLMIVIIIGTIMYLIEGGQNGYTSIPRAIYWAIVTLTTVGYGDISPQTDLGQFVASIVMILGYAIIAVPTGIVTAEFAKRPSEKASTRVCHNCLKEGHESDSTYCKFCGEKL